MSCCMTLQVLAPCCISLQPQLSSATGSTSSNCSTNSTYGPIVKAGVQVVHMWSEHDPLAGALITVGFLSEKYGLEATAHQSASEHIEHFEKDILDEHVQCWVCGRGVGHHCVTQCVCIVGLFALVLRGLYSMPRLRIHCPVQHLACTNA